mmetsp:Transcript_7207/g.14135  ORF Transcript_7207/g.14135 Transcript_7207/m.14135 type:complete len:144 (+) Transcript_7207:469-900(+)
MYASGVYSSSSNIFFAFPDHEEHLEDHVRGRLELAGGVASDFHLNSGKKGRAEGRETEEGRGRSAEPHSSFRQTPFHYVFVKSNKRKEMTEKHKVRVKEGEERVEKERRRKRAACEEREEAHESRRWEVESKNEQGRPCSLTA